jgi:hypothetical protein
MPDSLSWHRRLGGSLLFLLFELLEGPVCMAAHLVRSRLRKGLGLIAGASCDQREDTQTYDHRDPALLPTTPSMIHLRSLPPGDAHPVIQMRGTDRRLSV